MPEFKIQVDRLTDRPAHYDFRAEPEWWTRRAGAGDDPVGGVVDRPFHFELKASRLGDGLLIEGGLAGGLEVECSRCTRRYAHALRDTYRLVLKPRREEERRESGVQGSIDPEGERAIAEHGICLGDDLEAGWFRGPVIFLDDFFAEVVATAMPIQPLCDEDCPGLCPQCGLERGRDRRSESEEGAPVCACENEGFEKVPSPFAVLANLKDGLGRPNASSKSVKTVKKTQ